MESTTASPGVGLVALGPASAGRCRRRIHLDADPMADRSARTVLTDGVRHRMADVESHRDRVLDRLSSLLVMTADWQPASGGTPLVVRTPALRTATRFGVPDLLFWVGDGYLPVIIRNHRTTDPGAGADLSPLGSPLHRTISTERKARGHGLDALVLAHYRRMLDELGLASAQAWGGVIGRGVASGEGAGRHDDGAAILWYELSASGVLADYEKRFADRLRVATVAAAGAPALAVPSRIGECRRCSWWPVCETELTARHDISLISAGDDVGVLQAAGVFTIDQLAAMPGAAAESLPLTGVPAKTVRIRARAWLSGRPLVRMDVGAAVTRADVELDVDMESYLDDGAYLWGTYLTGPGLPGLGVPAGYRPFATWRPLPDQDEGRAFADFWTFLTDVRRRTAAAGLSFAAYCYSRSAEERWMRAAPHRFSQVPGMPSAAEVVALCDSSEWVDVYQEIRDHFVVPGSMKLKVLARLTGFAWRDAEPGGENSMAWYRAAIGADGLPPDPGMKDRVLRYNEDDVRATLALRRYLTEHGRELATVADLDSDLGVADPGFDPGSGARVGTEIPAGSVTAVASEVSRPGG